MNVGQMKEGRPHLKTLLLVLLLAASLRIFWLVTQTAVIESEGAEYARIAENLRAGVGYMGNMQGPELMFPPLYPILIALVSFFTGSFESAGRVTSLVMGILLIFPVFFIALRLYGQRVALISAGLVCFHPLLVALSASVYSEGSFLTLVMGGVHWGLRAFRLEVNKDSLLAGICFGLAYLVRPEAIAYPFLLNLAILVVAVTERKSLKRALLACGIVLGSFALLAAPYVLFLSLHTGHFRVEGKKNINLTISQRMNRGQSYLQAAYGIGPDLEEEGPLLDPNRFVGKPPAMSARAFANYFLEAAKRNKGALYMQVFPSYGFGPILMGMVILGLFGSPWNAKRFISEGYLLLMVSFSLLLMLSLHIFLYRYAFPLLPFLLLWSAKGIDELSTWAVATARLIKCRALPSPARVGTAVRWGVSVLLLILAFVGLRDVGEFEQAKPKYRAVKEAGLWLRSYRSGPKRIMNTNDTIPFYAQGLELEFPYCDSPLALAYIRRKNPDFIVLNALHGVHSRPYMEDWIKSGIPDRQAQLIYQTGNSLEEKILIYHWTEEPVSETQRPDGARASRSQ